MLRAIHFILLFLSSSWAQKPQFSATQPVPPNVDFAPVCNFDAESCPACDSWWHQLSDAGHEYTMHCEQSLGLVTTSGKISTYPGLSSASRCIAICDVLAGCQGAAFDRSTGACFIDTQGAVRLVSRANTVAYLRVQAHGVSSTPASTRQASASGLPTQVCSLSNSGTVPNCPTCNNTLISSSMEQQYRLLCLSLVISLPMQTVPSPVSLDRCLQLCNSGLSCVGANFYQGSCVLAFGTSYTISAGGGWTAFVKLSNSIPPSTSPSAVSGLTTPSSSIKSFVNTVGQSLTAQPSASSTRLPGGCSGSKVQCPDCDGVLLADNPGEQYRIICNRMPICRGPSRSSAAKNVRDCVKACNDDLFCFAGRFQPNNSSGCTLCEGRPAIQDGTTGEIGFYVDYQSIPQTAVWPTSFPEPTLMPDSGMSAQSLLYPTSTSTAFTSSLNTDRQLSAAVTTSAAPVPMVYDPPALRCPRSDGTIYDFGLWDSSFDITFRIMCDVVPDGSGNYALNLSSSLSDCAGFCHSLSCWAMAWTSVDLKCRLYESLEHYYGIRPITVRPSADVTAAVRIRPTSDPGVITAAWTTTKATQPTLSNFPVPSYSPTTSLERDFSCPSSDRHTYDITSGLIGSSFEVLCGVFLQEIGLGVDPELQGISSLSSFAECAQFCESLDAAGFVWRKSRNYCVVYNSLPTATITVYSAASDTAAVRIGSTRPTIVTATEGQSHVQMFAPPPLTSGFGTALSDALATPVVETF